MKDDEHEANQIEKSEIWGSDVSESFFASVYDIAQNASYLMDKEDFVCVSLETIQTDPDTCNPDCFKVLPPKAAKKVDFPDPEGPIMPQTCPFSTNPEKGFNKK
jgi:hypothetical protein